MFFQILKSLLPLSFEVLLSDTGNQTRASAIAAVRRAAIRDEKQHTIGIAMHQSRYGHVRILATGIGEFFGRGPSFLDAWDDLSANRAVRIVFIDQVEKVWCDRHRKFVACEQNPSAFLIGEFDVCLEIRE